MLMKLIPQFLKCAIRFFLICELKKLIQNGILTKSYYSDFLHSKIPISNDKEGGVNSASPIFALDIINAHR